jgi:hypothetical protein
LPLSNVKHAAGNTLGTATPSYGTALLQYVPVPSVPTVLSAEASTLFYNNVPVPGLIITGTGFSKDAEVLLEDTPVAKEQFTVDSPEKIMVVLPENVTAGRLRLTVQNPGGQVSNEFYVELAGP